MSTIVRVSRYSLLILSVLLVFVGAPGIAATMPPYMLINVQTQKCLTIAGGTSSANNLVAVQYVCDSDPSRRWRLVGSNGVFKIVNLKTGKCLTIAGGRSTENNIRAVQYNCDDDRSRRWTLSHVGTGTIYEVRNLQTGKCLTIAGGRSKANNVEALQYKCDGDPSRTWQIKASVIID